MTSRDTRIEPGWEALAEAARLETARVYAETLEQHRRRVALTPAPLPAVEVDDIDAAVDKRVASMVRAMRKAAS